MGFIGTDQSQHLVPLKRDLDKETRGDFMEWQDDSGWKGA